MGTGTLAAREKEAEEREKEPRGERVENYRPISEKSLSQGGIECKDVEDTDRCENREEEYNPNHDQRFDYISNPGTRGWWTM